MDATRSRIVQVLVSILVVALGLFLLVDFEFGYEPDPETSAEIQEWLDGMAEGEHYRDAARVTQGGVLLPGGLGVLVRSVRPDGIYERAGLRAGDVIVEANGRRTNEPGSAFDVMALFADVPLVQLRVLRADGGDEVVVYDGP